MKVLHIGKKGNVERYTAPGAIPPGTELADLPVGLAAAEYAKAAGDAEVIIADAMGAVSAELIAALPRLRLIHSEGVGYNFFDTAAASARHIYVCNGRGMNAMAVAEQTVFLMLALLRDAIVCDGAVRTAKQIEKKEGYMKDGSLKELADLTIGLVGFGDIARATAKLLGAFNAKVFYTCRHPLSPEEEAQYCAHYLPQDALLSACDLVSLHVPVTEETQGMANDAFFAKIREGAYFVNTSRGELVDSAALVRAMQSGKVFMAGLDTLSDEPVMPDNLLINQPEEISRRFVFSPHIAGITASSFKRGYAIAWENIRKLINNETPGNVVNAWNE